MENLEFYDEMGFKQLKQALNVSSADVAESLNFTMLYMLSEESIFQYEGFLVSTTDDLVSCLVLWR